MMNEFTTGIKTMFKEFFNKETNKKQRANMWTFSRIVLAFGIPITIIIDKLLMLSIGYIVASFLTIGATITDFIDGRSARKHHSISDFGKKLDILADKVFAFMMGISLSLVNPLFLFNILGEAMISFTNIHYQKKYSHLVPKSSYIGKVKQWPLSISFILGYLAVFFPQLTLITDIFIFISFIMEIVVLKNYININNYHVLEYNKSCHCNKLNTKNEDLNKEKTLKEEYVNLRNVLMEIKNIKEQERENIDIKVRKKQS